MIEGASAGVGALRPVIRREERRRRVLLAAIVAALLLGIAPVVGHHILGAVDWMSADQQHLAMFCLVALHLLLAPVHQLAHWVLYAGIVYAVIERGTVLWRHWRTMRALPSAVVPPGGALAGAAQCRVCHPIACDRCTGYRCRRSLQAGFDRASSCPRSCGATHCR